MFLSQVSTRLTRRFICHSLLCILSGLITGYSHAEILVSPTRVIFPSDKTEQKYRVRNQGTTPVMIQAWVDDQSEGGSPETAHGPFVVIPPVFRLEPGSLQSLRIMYNGSKQRNDRETLYWLNLYEIPSKPKNLSDAATVLSIAVKTQIKVLFRPTQLGTPDIKLIEKLRFSFQPQAGRTYLNAVNPTPFYITINKIELLAGQAIGLPSLFIAPFSNQMIEVKNFSRDKNKIKGLRFSIINDEGDNVMREVSIAS